MHKPNGLPFSNNRKKKTPVTHGHSQYAIHRHIAAHKFAQCELMKEYILPEVKVLVRPNLYNKSKSRKGELICWLRGNEPLLVQTLCGMATGE